MGTVQSEKAGRLKTMEVIERLVVLGVKSFVLRIEGIEVGSVTPW